MDNSQKAIQMAFAVFFFVIAATTAIFLYTNLIENSESILIISDRARMSAENALGEDISYKRYINRDEVIMTILDIENNTSYIDIIQVGSYAFIQDDEVQNLVELEKFINNANHTPDAKYTSEYSSVKDESDIDGDGDINEYLKTLTYTKK